MQEPAITPELIADHGLSGPEYDRILEIIDRELCLYRVGNLFGHVERTLFL